jgi:hypothetical protein
MSPTGSWRDWEGIRGALLPGVGGIGRVSVERRLELISHLSSLSSSLFTSEPHRRYITVTHLERTETQPAWFCRCGAWWCGIRQPAVDGASVQQQHITRLCPASPPGLPVRILKAVRRVTAMQKSRIVNARVARGATEKGSLERWNPKTFAAYVYL